LDLNASMDTKIPAPKATTRPPIAKETKYCSAVIQSLMPAAVIQI
jgi:hypothetical protein